MTDVPDVRLLEQFARNGSEEAFAALVQRHIALVHSVALRHTADAQHAQDITQAVFVILARKAGALGRKTVLPGWLYHTARLTAANLQRAEMRRVRREQEAFMQSKLEESPTDALWRELSPLLDEAMAGLGTAERDALVLRYFQNQSMAEVAKFLGLEENTAQKRVGRALEKLRKFFTKRGMDSTTAAIAENISAHSVQAVPVALAKSVTAVALAKGATASISTLTLIKGALKIMTWTKAKTAIVSGVVVLFVAGSTTLTIKEIEAHRPPAWQKKYDLSFLDSLPPQTKYRLSLPSTLNSGMNVWGSHNWGSSNGMALGLGLKVPQLLMIAYGVRPGQLIWKTPIPEGNYDFIANLPKDSRKTAQEEIKKTFGLTGRFETIETNVLILKVKTQNAPGLRRAAGQGGGSQQPGFYSMHNATLYPLVGYLERRLGAVIINQTKLDGDFDIDFKWDQTTEGLKQVLLDQLGLELLETNMPLEMLVVEKAK
jgi:uncharacterized protein (TIGR03435 family)